jgi:cobalamin biosynthesis protein CobD/CbiB
MAGALLIRLGGPSVYGGVLVEKPYIGAQNGEADYLLASMNALKIVQGASLCGFFLAIIVQFIWVLL